MFINKVKQDGPYYFLLIVIVLITSHSISNMLSSPLTSEQISEIKTKITAYNLEFVATKDKQFFGCGSGHLYRVPVITKNKQEQEVIVNYCSGNGLGTQSQIKI